MTSRFLIPDLQVDEGFRGHAYPDPLSGAEPWTIGYGCTGPDIGPDTVWTQPQALDALTARVASLTSLLTARLPWFEQISDLRQDVLVNMAYQMGFNGLMDFPHTLGCIKAADYAGAALGMLASDWARDQTPNRAKRLAEQMQTNTHQ